MFEIDILLKAATTINRIQRETNGIRGIIGVLRQILIGLIFMKRVNN